MAREHLKPFAWKPGQSGNPSGRPSGPTVSTILRQQLEANEGESLRGILAKLTDMALEGDIKAIREVFDRAYGRPKQSIEIDQRGETVSEFMQRIQREMDSEHESSPKKPKKPRVKPNPKPAPDRPPGPFAHDDGIR